MPLKSFDPQAPDFGDRPSYPTSAWAYLAATAKPLAMLAAPALIAYLAFELTPTGEPNQAKIQLFGGLIKTTIPSDLQMLYFVALMAGLGGFVAAAGHRETVGRLFWGTRLLTYLIQATGASFLGVVAYFLLRAGVFRATATAADINPLGMALLSLAIGISSSAIARWLRAVSMDLYGEQPEVARAIQRLEQRIESSLANPILDNFSGSVIVRVSDVSGGDLSMDEDTAYRAHPEQSCRLEVQFEAEGERSSNRQGLREELRIRNGNNSNIVTFDVAVDSLTVVFDDGRLSSTFPPPAPPSPLVFNFTVPSFEISPIKENRQHELFVEVSQKNRLLLSIPLILRSAAS